MDQIFVIQAFFFVIIIFSSVIHEYAHGWMADRLGDPTARLSGRLTINPLVHIDPVGTFMVPAALFLFSGGRFLFAWAKPVPVNPFNLKNIRFGTGGVAFAGPASNILMALIFGMMIRFLDAGQFSEFLAIIVYANLLLAVFNLVPIPPLDGSKILFAILPSQFNDLKIYFEAYGWVLLLFFALFFFNLLIPIIEFLFELITGQNILM
ncbi:MAG: Peptidase M50 [Parcubacteria group bacterium GW2011_GWA2_38_13]|nr:MAG: Peptidase M50 [Parcubacteria group bacterium GW2011_GWA2_38_13]